MKKKQTVVMTIEYDPAEVDAPANWEWATMLDIAPESIVSMAWNWENKDWIPEIEKFFEENYK